MPQEYRFIVKPTPPRDGAEIVTGAARFLKDIEVPGMFCGRVLRSPPAHALIKRAEPLVRSLFGRNRTG